MTFDKLHELFAEFHMLRVIGDDARQYYREGNFGCFEGRPNFTCTVNTGLVWDVTEEVPEECFFTMSLYQGHNVDFDATPYFISSIRTNYDEGVRKKLWVRLASIGNDARKAGLYTHHKLERTT